MTTSTREIPELTGWMGLPVAAEELGLSRQWVHAMVTRGDDGLRNVRKVRGTGDRPMAILIRTAEVERLKVARKAAEGCPECRRTGERTGTRPELCEHGPVEAAPDPELADALGMAGL